MKGRIIISLCMFSIFVITACAQKPYKGAEYRTKAAYLYGKFEVRMKSIGKEGTLASFFTYYDPGNPWNEIDIEIMGRYSDDVQFNTITPGQVNHVSHQFVNFDPALDYHVYGFEWTPDYVAWFIDSIEVFRQTGAHIASLNQSQKIMMNVWNPQFTNWAGIWNDAVLPAFAYYDWVKYASYTPETGSVGTDNNFNPQWIDNFDSWDQTKWDKASHTWSGNGCDFVYDNAVFQDGKLILCLTGQNALGYTDDVPPSVMWARAEGDTIKMFFSEAVNKTSAEANLNYILSSLSVSQAHLLSDQRTVILEVPGLSSSSIQSVNVLNVRDCWSTPNTMSSTNTTLVKQVPLSFPVKINIGGSTYQSYLADQIWNESVEYGYLDGENGYFSNASISGTTDQEVYRSELADYCEYKIRVQNGSYRVVLMMAENYFTDPNQRRMNIIIEGNQVETNLDLIVSSGYRNAYEKTAFISVSDGIIDIHAQALLDRPLLNGILITPISTDVNYHLDRNSELLSFEVFSNYPNPFNNGTTISFTIPKNDLLILKVFDILGRKVSEKLLGEYHEGISQVFWDARDDSGSTLSSGIYYYCIEGSVRSSFHKLLYLK